MPGSQVKQALMPLSPAKVPALQILHEVDEYAEILCLALLTRVFVNVCLQLWSPLLEKAFAIHAGDCHDFQQRG